MPGNRARGCLLGQLAGDALGSLVELQSPEEIRRNYPEGVGELADGGTWNTIAGQPTDDSEMALLLARMLTERGTYDPDVMSLFTDKEVKALNELFHEVGVYRHSKALRELFDFIKKFPKVAPFNAFLLHIQKSGSQYVASASEWREQFKRTIKPGVHPLVILWPFVHDTRGKSRIQFYE